MPGSPARKLGDRETGGGLALPVWIEYMQTALKDVPQVPLVPPEGVMTDDEKKSIRYLFKTGN
jgi:membrane carboxypeptidase/penicillin-binding protein